MTAVVGAARTETEASLANVLADLVAASELPLDAHFFNDLGADSMVMARFCARVRKHPDLRAVSMKDVYNHPTIGSLAIAISESAPAATVAPAPVVATPPQASTFQYALCGALQLLAVLSYSYLATLLLFVGYQWIGAGTGPLDTYLRAVAFGGTALVGLCTVPILAKWLFVGRWKPQRIRVWSLGYGRFWVVKTLVRSNPLVLFAGSPLYVLYLRALGARIGPRALVLSRHVPVCTDLLTVGAGTVVHKDSFLTCYRAEAGVIQTGAVSIGIEAVVGERAVLDIDTSIGDQAELSHSSSLQAGQSVPDGQRWDGATAHDRPHPAGHRLEHRDVGPLRPVVYTLVQLLAALLVYAPVLLLGMAALVVLVPPLEGLLGPGAVDLSHWTTYVEAVVYAGTLYLGFLLVALLVVMTVPRLLNVALVPDRSYPLYGVHYWAHRTIERLTNPSFFPHLLGDSSYIVPYLRWLGYDLSDVQQTGSNFGLEVKHENPFLCSVGRGTMAADGLSIVNTEFSATTFRLTRATIGSDSFLGNYIVYPPQARTGDNCLLATKLTVPVDGEIREGVGLLGSPSFDIPRTVQRDECLAHLGQGREFPQRLKAKNRHNAIGIGLHLLSWWVFLAGVILLVAAAAELNPYVGAWAYAVANVVALAFRAAYFVLVERASTQFRPLRPRSCSIYDPYFWWHERYWKLSWQPLVFDGTPFKTVVWRLMGVRIGKRVFDDGCVVMDKTLVSIGDDCTLGDGSTLQPHSQEDGAFKSDRIAIGAGCTLGIGSLVQYGATMGDGSALAPDAFLMKGEQVPARARWHGNPAREL